MDKNEKVQQATSKTAPVNNGPGDLTKEIALYQREINKDLFEVKNEKKKFIKDVLGGLGEHMKDFENYKKKKPSRLRIIWNKFKRVLWNV